jgi:hypothetical protein
MVEPFNSSVEMDYDKMVYENKGWGENMTGGGYDMSGEKKSPEMEYDEMVYNKEDDKIMAGGYSVNSLLLNQGMPAAYVDHVGGKGKKHVDEKVSDRFKHLAIPAGLYLGTNSNDSNPKHVDDASVINDDLYDKLLKLAQHDDKNDKDKKTQIYKKKNTKKNKKKKSIKHKTRRR